MYCGIQEIALHGHRKTLSSHSVKQRQLELIGLLAKYGTVIHNRLNNGPKCTIHFSWHPEPVVEHFREQSKKRYL